MGLIPVDSPIIHTRDENARRERERRPMAIHDQSQRSTGCFSMSTNSRTHCRTVDVADLQSRTRRSASVATTFAVLTTWAWVMVCACCSSRSRLYAAQISALVDLLVMDMDNSFGWLDRERRPMAIHEHDSSHLGICVLDIHCSAKDLSEWSVVGLVEFFVTESVPTLLKASD